MFSADRRDRREHRVADRHARRAARRERTARRQGREVWHRAVDRLQARAGAAAWNRGQQPARVRMLRIVKDVPHRALFDDPAGVHHRHAVRGFGDHAEVVGDQQQRQVELALHVAQQVENLRLHGDIERRGRLVGDHERRLAGERHRHHHALAHAARQLMRVVVHALLGIGDLDGPQQLDRPLACASDFDARPCTTRASAMCEPTRITGLSAAIGSWKTNPMPAPRTCRMSRSGSVSRSRPWKITWPAATRPGGCTQANQRERRDRLAAARLADQPQRFALADLERHVVDGHDGRGRVSNTVVRF